MKLLKKTLTILITLAIVLPPSRSVHANAPVGPSCGDGSTGMPVGGCGGASSTLSVQGPATNSYFGGTNAPITINVFRQSVNHVPDPIRRDVTTAAGASMKETFPATDSDGDTLTYSEVLPGLHGTIAIVGNNITYTPMDPLFKGTDTCLILADDSHGGKSIQILNVNVGNASGILPTAQNGEMTVSSDQNTSFDLAGSIANGTISQISKPYYGLATLANTTVTYTPVVAGDIDSIAFIVADANGNQVGAFEKLDRLPPGVTSADLYLNALPENGGLKFASFTPGYGNLTTNFNTTQAPFTGNGRYTVFTVVHTQSENASSQGTILIDNTAPSCDYVSPETPLENEWRAGLIPLRVRSSDPDLAAGIPGSGVQGVKLMDPQNTNVVYDSYDFDTNTTNEWKYFYYDSRQLPHDGNWLFDTICFDNANNDGGHIHRHINIDNTKPNGTILPANTLVNGLVTFEGDGDDGAGSGVKSVELKKDGVTIATANGPTVSKQIDTSLETAGDHTFELVVVDNVNNSRTVQKIFTFDNSGPSITIVSPTGTVSAPLTTAAATIDDPHGPVGNFGLLIDGVAPATFTPSGTQPNFTFTYSPATTSAGPHTITISAADALGNTSSKSGSFIISSSGGGPLSVQFVSPLNGDYINGASDVTVFASGATGVWLVVNGGVEQPMIDMGGGTYKLTLNVASEGSTTLQAIARDSSNQVSANETVTVDNTKPSGTLLPAEGSTISGIVNIQTSATDNFVIDTMSIEVDGVEKTNSHPNAASANLNYALDTAPLSIGSHTLTLKATDKAGNLRTVTNNVLKQSGGGGTLPVIHLNGPLPGSSLRRTVTVNMSVTSDSPLTNVGIRIDGDSPIFATQSGDNWLTTFDTRINPNSGLPFVQGFHNITLVARNDTGSIETPPFQYYFDNIDPTLTINKPHQDDVWFYYRNITVTATDNSNADGIKLNSVRFTLNSTHELAFFPGNPIGNNTYVYTLDTTQFPDGQYRLDVYATDAAGNVAHSFVGFEINNTNIPLSNYNVTWSIPDFIVDGIDDPTIRATVTGGNVDPTGIDQSIKVFQTRNGVAKEPLAGLCTLAGNTVTFGTRPDPNSRLLCVFEALDDQGKLIKSTKNAIFALNKDIGGTLTINPEGLMRLTVSRLPEHALVEMVKLAPNVAPDSGNDSQLVVYGPIQIIGTPRSGVPLNENAISAGAIFQRPVPPAQESGYIDQAQKWVNNTVWKPLGNSGGSALKVKDGGSVRTISVPVESFGLYRVTSFPVPGDGITNLFNMPNPASPYDGCTDFSYLLGGDSDVDMTIYDLVGNLVRHDSIGSGNTGGKIGQNILHWDCKNGVGDIVGNGGYVALFTVKDTNGKVTRARRKVAVVK